MKAHPVFLSISFLLLILGTAANSQFMFSVRPQLLGLNGAAFGFKPSDNLAVFGGMDYVHAGATIDASTTYSYPAPTSSRESEASLSLYNVFVGQSTSLSRVALRKVTSWERSRNPSSASLPKRTEQRIRPSRSCPTICPFGESRRALAVNISSPMTSISVESSASGTSLSAQTRTKRVPPITTRQPLPTFSREHVPPKPT